MLERFLKEDHKTRPMFYGVYPVDQLPRKRLPQTRPRIFIVNTDESRGRGKHWILIFLKKDYRAVYFDSFGRDVEDGRILKFLQVNCHQYEYNNTPLQGVLSSTCGHYCLYVAKKLARGHSLQYILRSFRVLRPYFNDRYVVSRLPIFY
jgi:hypothetical protein